MLLPVLAGRARPSEIRSVTSRPCRCSSSRVRLRRVVERIVAADVDPDRRRSAVRPAEEVVTPEVLRVVERARRSLAAGSPERGRMAADGAEARRVQPREVERAEAAHRDAADRDPVGVGAEAFQRRRNRLADDVLAPAAVAAIVVVAVVVTVDEQDGRRARPQLVERRPGARASRRPRDPTLGRAGGRAAAVPLRPGRRRPARASCRGGRCRPGAAPCRRHRRSRRRARRRGARAVASLSRPWAAALQQRARARRPLRPRTAAARRPARAPRAAWAPARAGSGGT